MGACLTRAFDCVHVTDQGDTSGHAVFSGQFSAGRWRSAGGAAGGAESGRQVSKGCVYFFFGFCRVQ